MVTLKNNYPETIAGHSDSGEPSDIRASSGTSETHETDDTHRLTQGGGKFKGKKRYFMGTYNINSLIQIGKLRQLTQEIRRLGISILALQETRFTDEEIVDFGGYRILKGKPGKRIMRNMPHLGTAFLVDHKYLNSIEDFTSKSPRLSTLTVRGANKKYTLINAHAPINVDNKRDPDKVDEFWGELEEAVHRIPRNNVKILLGDFNAQIGREKKFRETVGFHPGHYRTNRNGERLIGLCREAGLKIMSTHYKNKMSRKKTWVSPNPNLGEFQLDHVAITRRYHREIQNVRVKKAINVTSDHYPSQIKIKIAPVIRKGHTNKGPQAKRIDRDTLTNHKAQEFQEKLEPASTWEDLTGQLTRIAEELAPQSAKNKVDWWNHTCDEAITNRLNAWKTWNQNKSETNRKRFEEERKKAAKHLRTQKRELLNNQLQRANEDFQENRIQPYYRTCNNRVRGYVHPNLVLKRGDGGLAHSKEEVCGIFAAYFKKLLNCDKPIEKIVTENNTPDWGGEDPPDKEEIDDAIAELKNNKAPGEDGVIAEMWKLTGDEFRKRAAELMMDVWIKEEIPKGWGTALITPLHKKGNTTDVDNYRGISLLPVTYKIFSKLLLKRLTPQLDPKLGEYQGGFRKGRSCPEQILSLKLLIKKFRNHPTKNLFITFVDFKKAYDSVDRETLIRILAEYGVDAKLQKLIGLTLENTTSKIKFRGVTSEPFTIDTGLRQGDGLSPLLFNVVLDKIMKDFWKENDIGATLGGKKKGLKVRCLAYADDLALLAESEQDAVRQLNCLKEIAEKTGLQVSYEKTEFMTTDSKFGKKWVETKFGKIKVTDHFKYLGEIVSNRGSEKRSLETRIAKLEHLNHATTKLYGKKCLSKAAKLRHYNTVIRPVILYGAETMQLPSLEKIKTIERKILRKIHGPRMHEGEFRRRANKELYQGNRNIEDEIRARRLKFYGHMIRMPEERLNKQIFRKIWGYKSDGGYSRQVKEEARSLGIEEADCLDRDSFRRTVNSVESFVSQGKSHNNRLWTDERKLAQSERMKERWVLWKARGTKKKPRCKSSRDH
ncbi:reverse transcriptase domain-containing protein [Pantoea sp. Taur]|uniref:reverse transcriptase domain-containing protein n=1 Tax=Pantoea sp. Taur TaxID=2576757 RepID=UPI001352DF43|nr:reverse transcriptase domain-containing protein [Pantoea sp. Taur]MXP61689.1 hypothetical protein [Pantoea sp. Taur]